MVPSMRSSIIHGCQRCTRMGQNPVKWGGSDRRAAGLGQFPRRPCRPVESLFDVDYDVKIGVRAGFRRMRTVYAAVALRAFKSPLPA
jgi:hypothetical protein